MFGGIRAVDMSFTPMKIETIYILGKQLVIAMKCSSELVGHDRIRIIALPITTYIRLNVKTLYVSNILNM
jgi:hypothetical protein